MRISDWSSDVCSSDLVHRMGGELELESVPGTGSTFRFELRLARTTPEPALPATEPRRIVRGKRILVADDNRTNLVLIGEMLESDKHQVISVDSGHGALERSEEHTSELQSLMRISYAVFCFKKNTKTHKDTETQ